MKTMKLKTLTAASLMALASTAQAATTTDTLTNLAIIADACDVVAIGVNFGTVPMPLVVDFPGALPNTTDDGGDTLSVLGLSIPFVAAPGVYVVCTATPSSIAITTPNGSTVNLSTAIGGSPTATLTSKMKDGTNSLDYTMTLVGTSLGVSGLGLPLGVFAAVYAGVGSIPAAQSGTFGPGTYTDVATITITY